MNVSDGFAKRHHFVPQRQQKIFITIWLPIGLSQGFRITQWRASGPTPDWLVK